MNSQVDVIIIGDSKEGREAVKALASERPTIKFAFISREFKSFTTHDYLNVEYFRNEVTFTDYKNRLFCCYLNSGRRIYATHLIIASGLAYSPLMLTANRQAVGVYNNADDIPKAAKNQPAVVICNQNSDVKFALEVAKKYKQVYLCVKNISIQDITEANIKKLEKAENIVVLPNTAVIKTISKDGVLLKVELNNYSTINCSAIYAKTDSTPDVDFVSDKLIQKTDTGYLVTNEKAESTIVPKFFVAGNCAQKYTKAQGQALIGAILSDF